MVAKREREKKRERERRNGRTMEIGTTGTTTLRTKNSYI